ncbi:MAG: hypothetical protein EXX96DRAFT_507377 [Benjaminiella poitrasii]|nr:MAG: hypothetical protein EXX96DRAFT_507377 [Benjaminiella poitrasii]
MHSTTTIMNSPSPSPSTSSNSTTTRKRTHLKPSQVEILQESFNTNPLPDSSVRSRLARELAVTERTIQIWFQNRRAKARKVEALGAFSAVNGSNAHHHLMGAAANMNASLLRPDWITASRHSTPPRYQATFRTMMTPERFEELKHQDQHQIRRRPRSSSKPEPKSSHLLDMTRGHDSTTTTSAATTATRAMSEGLSTSQQQNNTTITQHPEVLFPANNNTTMTASSNSSPMDITSTSSSPIQMVPLPVNVLRIGTWTRFTHAAAHIHQRDWDLVCYGSPVDRELVWRVQAEGHHFRIQISFDQIQQLRLSQQIQVETGDLVGQLDIELNLPLAFSMWRFGQDLQWVRCGDFTEDKQASVDGLHILQGNHDAFKQALLDLIAMTPELATKMSVMPPILSSNGVVDLTQPPPLDLCRDFTMSPSATPEPSSLTAAGTVPHQLMYHGNLPYTGGGMINPQHLSKANMSHLMLQAPFFYPQNSNSNSNHYHHHSTDNTTTTEEDLYHQMILHSNNNSQHAMFSQLNHSINPSILM